MSNVVQMPSMHAQAVEQFSRRVLSAAAGALEVMSIYIGDQLGLYDALVQHGPATSHELAERTGTAERYVREWLEQQAVVGILGVHNHSEAHRRQFYVPLGHDEVLTNRDSLNYLAPLSQLMMGAIAPISRVLEAFKSGEGVPFQAYGPDVIHGQGRMNRAAFLYLLGQEWIPAVPEVKHRLESDPPAQVADFGCGVGWSSIGLARSYPKVRVDGFDLDASSIELAITHLKESGVRDRVQFEVRDAGDPALHGHYDLVMALECLHDMSNPVAALSTMRRLLKPDGVAFIADERVADEFDPSAGGLEWLMYGCSIVHCLPVGMAEQPSAATGTVMRTSTFEGYARQAGFEEVEVLPIDYALFRFYLLRANR